MFYDKFEHLCILNNVKPATVAKQCGGNSNSAYSWKNGTPPNSSIVIKIAKYFHVSTDYLLMDKDFCITSEGQILINNFERLSDTNKQLITQHIQSLIELQESENKTVSIKHSKHKVSAGLGDALYEADNFENILIYDSDIVSKADFALTVDGDSMMPKLYNDDIILVKQQDAVDVGEICVYILSGEGFVKKYGGDRLISLNPKYKDILLENYSTDEIKCCGLVLGKAQIADSD